VADREEIDPANFDNPYDYYLAHHDWLSRRFSWHGQHFNERLLDLRGFIFSISGALEEERLDYGKHTYPLGFFEVEQPSRIRYAQVIFLFTIYERRIRALCKLIDEVDPATGPRLDDFRGTLSDRVKDLFRARLKIDLGGFAAWERLQTVQKVRDCIIHCGGRVTESRDERYLLQVAKTGIGLGLSTRDYLYVDEPFSEFVEHTLFDFFGILFPETHRIIRGRFNLQVHHPEHPA